MTTNQYIDHYRQENEYNLQDDLVIESIQFYGQDCVYIPRTDVIDDELQNEVTDSNFRRGFDIEMYVEEFENFAASSFFLDRLGLQSPTEGATIIISKTRFENIIDDSALRNPDQPNEGDIIFVPGIQKLFEIKAVDTEVAQRYHVYKLECQPFRSSGEQFLSDDLDDPIIDLLEVPDELTDDNQPIEDYDEGDTYDNELINDIGVIPDRR